MLNQLYILPILLFSVVIHEISHGWMALRLGDPTAKQMGRLTLNPIPHIDPIGSVAVPLFSLFVAGSVFIAWAKPVPVNPLNFRNYRRDDILVSIVGPFSNIALAFGCTLMVMLISAVDQWIVGLGVPYAAEFTTFAVKMFYAGMYLNIVLAVFNMIPIPPLDGSHVVASLLPDEVGEQYRRIGFLGIFLILFIMRYEPFRVLLWGVINTLAFPFNAMIHVFG
jgi:Zn-dependent protease